MQSKTKWLALGALMVPMLAWAAAPSMPDSQELSGDVGDACKAVLCLSSAIGRSESECQPPLQRYFSISAKKWSDTMRQRKGFLALCPTGDFQGRDDYLDTLADSSGRCDAATLNATLRQSKTFQVCRYTRNGEVCEPFTKWRISDQLPNYCRALFSNSYTDFKGVAYKGSADWQPINEFMDHPAGKWIDS